MKNLFVLAVLLLVQAALAYEIDFTFAGDEYGTNFTAVVSPGEDFTYNGKLTFEQSLTKMTVSRLPDQTAHYNAGLFIGLTESTTDLPLYDEMFGDDAWVMGEYVSEFFSNREIMTGPNVKKDRIREIFQGCSASFDTGDTFLFYYSGIINSDASMALYDDNYTSTEFAEDLSLFKDGVIIIVVLDADNAHLLANKGIQKDNKNFLMIASDKNLPAKHKKWKKIVGKWQEEVSPFTMGLWLSRANVTDLNEDGLLSCDEYFLRAKAWLASKNLTNQPSMNNQELASKIYFSPVPYVSSNGRVYVNHEDDTFKFTLPNIQSDAVVYIEEGETKEDYVITPKKASLSANLKEAGPNLSTKLSLTFNVEDIPEIDYLSISFGNYFMPFDTFLKETERSLTMATVDYDFNITAKFKFSIKKGYCQCNINLNGISKIANELKFEDGEEIVPLMVNCRGMLSGAGLSFIKTYKPGKTFSAKLDTRK